MKKQTKSLLEIHLAVLLFGLAGLFGELHLPAVSIVFGRVFFASLTLGAVLLLTKQQIKLKAPRDYLAMACLGAILAFHWLAFFQAIQLSSVAIGLLTFSTFPVFTTFMEPIFFKERLKRFDVFTALLALIGVVIVIPHLDLSNHVTQGVVWGTFSGFAFALLSILNRKYVKAYSGTTLAFYQEAAAALLLVPFVLQAHATVSTHDILMLVLLGVVFTALSHTLFIRGLTHVKAQTASVIATLEPVYGILFALLLFDQVPGLRTLIGGAAILAATVIASTTSLKTNE